METVMAKISLDKLSVADLKELQRDVATALVQRQAQEREQLKQDMQALAARHGLSLDEIVGRGKGKKGGTVAVKYRNSDNMSETWTGRGRQPRWLVAQLKKGAKLEKFLVK
jgi:DNA-binding protein H-NS